MRLLSTSLGAWDTIESGTNGTHGETFPLALLHAVLTDAGLPRPECWEGDARPSGPWDVVLVSAMDPRHFWRIPDFLRAIECPVRAEDRGENDPIVVMGGQAATAPAPVAAFVDVVFIGEAEAGASEVIGDVASGPRRLRLERAAQRPGCWVPSVHPPDHVVHQVFADDISTSLRHLTSVSLRKLHRVEIARGCRSKCGFCVLGWRAPYRENSAEAVGAALDASVAAGVREVHLSAGDAEGHRQIEAIRQRVSDLGIRDHGWTGRLDTMRDCSVSAGKLFAFGIEGMSHRLRKAVGKARLTDDYIIGEMVAFWEAGGRRAMWHMIGGLPSECDEDEAAFTALLRRLRREAPRDARLHLELGRQPFGPMPHTPMQWFAPGLTSERVGRAIEAAGVNDGVLAFDEKAGQTLRSALYSVLVMRGGAEVTSLIEAGAPSLGMDPRPEWERWVTAAGLNPRHYVSAWPVARPVPWDFVVSANERPALEKAYQRIRATLYA